MKSKNWCHIFTLSLQKLWGILREPLMGLLAHLGVFGLFIVTTPLLIYRKFVSYLARLFDDDITTCITGLSALFLRDFDCYHEKSHSTSVACLKMKGAVVETSVLQKAFMDRVVLRKSEKDPQKLCYPELQQYYTRFMGYMFFKWDRDFDIRNHIILHHETSRNKEIIVTRKTLIEIWEHLMIKPFPKNKSPWEMIVVPNYIPDEGEENPPDWVIFLRLHHGIADGHWFANSLVHLFSSPFKPSFTTKLVSNVTPLQKGLMHLRCAIFGPYDFVNRYFRFREAYHGLHMPHFKLSKTYYLVEGPIISIKSIKKIKNHFRVAFTAVLFELITGGIRRYMLKKGMRLPEMYSVGLPFPKLKEREDKMGNDFYLTIHDLPINTPRIQDRLLSIHQSLLNLQNSSFMQMSDIIFELLSCLPSPLLRAVTRKSMFGTSYSTLPGPTDGVEADWFGYVEMIDSNFSHGLSTDSLGLGFSTLTFLDHMRMTVFADRNLVEGRAEAQDILNCLMEEYAELKMAVNP